MGEGRARRETADRIAAQRPAPDDGGSAATSMFETIREYGLELLAAAGDLDAVLARHTRYYVDYTQSNDLKLYTYPIDPMVIDAWVGEHDNIRSVLRRAIDSGDATTALQLCGTMRRFWNSR